MIEGVYGHKTFYLIAMDSSKIKNGKSEQKSKFYNNNSNIAGILPLTHLNSIIFNNSLISIPFFDLGGVLADNEDIEKELILEAVNIGQELKVDNIELRHTKPLNFIQDLRLKNQNLGYETRAHKVRMLLQLPDSSGELMKSFKSKLRSQINKPVKEGLKSKTGGIELLDDFYQVFTVNMRDLGSPVHSKKILEKVLVEFSESARMVIVYKGTLPLAGSIIIGFNKILENPWASSLRDYSRLSPNMLLYWTMLEYACDNEFEIFDFGRSSPDEGTYRFKEQWGATPTPLSWQYIYLNGGPQNEDKDEKSKFDAAIRYWQKLPVWVTRIIGPMIRKNIGL
ncbi:MAG: FemAB family PEP-CTERM system-associated protein [Desulfatiglans sp.]|nr:FemAB family PEP-CTERM system-associated protein [Desulfatiglans sp.]